MKQITCLAKLITYEEDCCDYTSYVFKVLDGKEDVGCEYVLCTKFPNWNQAKIEINDVGFLTFMEIKAGVDTWYDGIKMNYYKYNNIQFLKFIEKKKINKFKM